jgi:hypothetical protein
MESNELNDRLSAFDESRSGLAETLSGSADEIVGGSSRCVASLNDKPHDEHATASGEISLWQRGQFTGGGLYH